jgi:hypothetical protein
MHIPGSDGYIGRALLDIRDNLLRGRQRNKDAVFIWHIDKSRLVQNLITNHTVHGAPPIVTGDTLDEMIWAGPMVIVMKEDSMVMDPRLCKDITLEAYKDAIDHLSFYHDGYGSAIDSIGTRAEFAKRVLESKGGKTVGIRVNCASDQVSQGWIGVAPIPVPKMHPLFDLESDDPPTIPEILGHDWVAKKYGGGSGATRGLQNSLAQLLFLRLDIENSRWVGSRESHGVDRVGGGSVLVVDRRKHEVKEEEVRSMCRLTKDVVVPLMTEETARLSNGRRMIVQAVKAAADKYVYSLHRVPSHLCVSRFLITNLLRQCRRLYRKS